MRPDPRATSRPDLGWLLAVAAVVVAWLAVVGLAHALPVVAAWMGVAR